LARRKLNLATADASQTTTFAKPSEPSVLIESTLRELQRKASRVRDWNHPACAGCDSSLDPWPADSRLRRRLKAIYRRKRRNRLVGSTIELIGTRRSSAISDQSAFLPRR
jgi:hypothetical protein